MPLTEIDLNHIFKNTEPLWQSVRNRRFFVTGGTGFIGKWLLESFAYINHKLNLNCQMLVLSRAPEKFIRQFPHFQQFNEIAFQKADVKDFKFPDEKFDYIIHAATDVITIHSANLLELADTIIYGTRRTLDFAKQCGAKRFLFLSSGAVYGKQPDNMSNIPESYNGAPDPLDMLSAYGQAKRIAELFCSIYHKHYGIETSIARCFAFLGPYLNLDIQYAIGNFIRDGLKGQTINILGDGTPCRSYLYAADLAVWLWTILLKGKPGQAYNVGSDEGICIAELTKQVSKCFPQPPKVKFAKKPEPGTMPERYIPSIERAKNELGLQCRINLDEAIKRTIEFNQIS